MVSNLCKVFTTHLCSLILMLRYMLPPFLRWDITQGQGQWRHPGLDKHVLRHVHIVTYFTLAQVSVIKCLTFIKDFLKDCLEAYKQRNLDCLGAKRKSQT